MRIIQLATFVMLAFWAYDIKAQITNHGPTISGIFLSQKEKAPDSIEVLLQDTDLDFRWQIPTHYNIKVSPSKSFSITLPNFKRPILIEFRCFRGRQPVSNGRYIVEPNDNIKMKIFDTKIGYLFGNNMKADSISFSGVGAEKYRLIQTLEKTFLQFFLSTQIKGEFSDADSLNYYLQTAFETLSNYKNIKANLISKSNGISPEMRNLVNDNFAFANEILLSSLPGLYRNFCGGKPELLDIVKTHVQRNVPSILNEVKVINSKVLGIYPYQVKAGALKVIPVIQSQSSNIDLLQYYNLLLKDFAGLHREGMIMDLLFGRGMSDVSVNTPKDYDFVVKDAKKYLKTPEGIEGLKSLELYKNGSEVPHGEFTDTIGNKFSLKSLVGKVVLIDVWFTGCTGCAEFHERFEKQIHPEFKRNQDFVYLSLNADRDSSKWLKSILTNKYTTNKDLNVFSGGLGFDHPFFKHYQIQGGPFLIVLDRAGKFYTKIESTQMTVDNLKNILSDALAESL